MADQPRRVVMVVTAHPDDSEFMCGGTIARWVSEGSEAVYVICTNGDKGSSDPGMTPDRLAEIRQREQRAAASALGVKEVVFLGYEDGVLQDTLQLRRDIVRQIRRFKPDALICGDPTHRWSGSRYLNHPDHRAAAGAALDAVFPSARDRMVFPELLAEGLEPHKVSEIYIGQNVSPDVWIDITGSMDTKLEALKRHASQMGDDFEKVAERIRSRSAETVEVARKADQSVDGMKYAESFKYVRLD